MKIQPGIAALGAVIVSTSVHAQLGSLGDLAEAVEPVSSALAPVVRDAAGDSFSNSGYFESFNGYWAQPTRNKNGYALLYDAEQRSVDADADYVSVSFFPAGPLQIDALRKLKFHLFPEQAQSCPANSVRAEILINSNQVSGPRVRATLKPGASCSAGIWNIVDMLNDTQADWSSSGGLAFASQQQAHQWAQVEGGDDYEIWGIRIQFLGQNAGGGFGPKAWVDSIKVNDATLGDPSTDLGFYSNFGEDDAGVLLGLSGTEAALPGLGLGWYASRNVRWGIPTRFSPGSGEAMHFSEHSRTEDSDFMSVSFFVQEDLQLSDLSALSAQYMPLNGSCDETGTPRFWLVLESASGDHSADVFVEWQGDCTQGRWLKMKFFTQYAAWRAENMPMLSAERTRDAMHDNAVEALGEDYRIQVIRFVHENGTADAWIDSIQINGVILGERILDMSPASQEPDLTTLGF